MASITLRGFCFFYLAVVLCLVKLQAVPSSECGNWQRNYRTLHQDILNNKLDPAQVKFLISIAPPQGLADRIGGYITHFLFALLSDRAYLQITLPLDVPMSAAYDCKFVDSDMWSHLQNSNGAFHDSFGVMQDEFLALPIGGYRTINKYIAEHPKTTSKPIDLSTNYGEYLNGGPDMTSKQRIGIRKKNKQLFVGSDFNALPFSDKKRVFFLGNRGFSYAMFDNPHHNATLVSMGLTRDNAFRCVYQFLFGFNMQLHCSEVGGCKHMWDAVRDRHTAGGTVIGVHVRVGDAVFTKGITGADDLNGQLWGVAEPFLQCALSLRTELSPSPPLLFLSDSVELRKMVLSRLGSDIIITDTTIAPKHVAYRQQSQTEAQQSLVHAARELELLALCDYHVISARSGFGQKAAFMNRKPFRDHIFYPPPATDRGVDESVKCSLEHPSSAAMVASHWSGV